MSFPDTDQGEVMKSLGSGLRLPEFKSWLCLLLGVTLSTLSNPLEASVFSSVNRA